MRAKAETAVERHRRVFEALEQLEEHAVTLGSPGATDFSKRRARTGLAAAALLYAARVRRLAGVR